MKTQETGYNSIVLTTLFVCFVLGVLGICALTNYQGLFEFVFTPKQTTIKIDGRATSPKGKKGEVVGEHTGHSKKPSYQMPKE
jgi:hypothetical protein